MGSRHPLLAFSLLVFRYPSWRFRVQSVMCHCAHSFLHLSRQLPNEKLPSLNARHAACLTNVPSCFVDGQEDEVEWA